MQINEIRQLQDIQHQADKLLQGDPESEAIEAFARYNEEMKSYLQTHLEDAEIRNELSTIPDIHDIHYDPVISSFVLSVILALITLGVSLFVIGYLSNARRTREMLYKVEECKAAYARIEFLIKSKS